MAHYEKRLEGETIYQGKVFRVERDKVELENGNTSIREIVRHNGGACIAALSDEDEVYMVRQFRYAFGKELWELPAGKLEPGEDPFEAAKRELAEEAGLTARHYTDLGVFYPTVGYCTEIIYTWAATGLEPVPQHLDEDEFLTVYKIPLQKALEMVYSGEIQDGKTALGILKLADLRGADYNDARWDSLLDQLSVQDMLNMTSLCGYQTPAVESVGKVQTNDADGPAAINNNFTGAGSIGFPIPTVTACTWNQDLAHAYGEMMGKMARELDVAGWYAPGINLHRNAFGGRNYEYYSEDAVLTGKMAGNAVAGAETQGVYSYIKHFALYDGNYKMVSIWSNEQAMREIYLKPFEICVKDYGADAVMDSWNFLGVKWTGENSNLLNTVLRDEWGFRGMVESDYFRDNGHGFMNADAGLANGMDAMLSTYGAGPNLPHDHDDPSASTVKYLRQACKNIMYTVVNSWVYEDGAAASDTNGWVGILVGADVAAGVVLVGLEVLLVRSWRKRQAKETARK